MARLVELIGAGSTLFIAAAGAGLLSYPFAVKQLGVGLALLCTLIFAVLNAYTDLVLCASAHAHRKALVSNTFEGLCLAALGPFAFRLALVTVLVGCLGSLIGFQIIIAE